MDRTTIQQAQCFLQGAEVCSGTTRHGTPFAQAHFAQPQRSAPAFTRTGTIDATVQDAAAFLQGFDNSLARRASDPDWVPTRQTTMEATLNDASLFLQGFDPSGNRHHEENYNHHAQPMTPPSPSPTASPAAEVSPAAVVQGVWHMTTRMQQARMDDSPARNLRSSPPRPYYACYTSC